MSETPRDVTLIARCLEHDEEAWRLLVGQYTSYMYTIAIRGFGIDAEEAREVVQDSLLKLFEGLPGYRGEGEFRAWLRQIVRNCCRAHLQRRRATEPLDETLRDRHQEEALEQIERAFVLSEAVRSLDEPCREIISLFFFQGRPYKEIGAALAIPEGTVASRLARCLTKLRSKMRERS
jgi:RNA polymerase sigma-70 factor (ECF subfamily)